MEKTAFKKHKLVVNQLDGTVTKGYFFADPSLDLNKLHGNSELRFEELLESQYLAEDGTPLPLDWTQVKAAFFVASLTGDRSRDPVRFYNSGPVIHSVWVEVVFRDGEVIEGWIRNSIQHLIDDGFFLEPSTPDSNNLLIYVNKAAIIGYRVLGVRTQIED